MGTEPRHTFSKMQFIVVFALLSAAAALPLGTPAVKENLIDSSPVVGKTIGGNSEYAFGALVDQNIPTVDKQQDAFQYPETNANDNFGVESANTYNAPQATTFDASTPLVDQSVWTNENSPSQYDASNPIQSNVGSGVPSSNVNNLIQYRIDSLEDDDDSAVFYKSGSPQATLYNANTQKSIFYGMDSLEDDFYTTPVAGTLYSGGQNPIYLGDASVEDDGFPFFYKSGSQQIPQHYTSLDLSQVNFQNVRSTGHAEQIVVPSDSGEVEAYRLVGMAPSNAVRLGSFTPTTYSANMGQEVPIYKEIDDDDFYGLPGTQNVNAIPSLYSAAAGSSTPIHVKAETTMSGNNVVLLLD